MIRRFDCVPFRGEDFEEIDVPNGYYVTYADHATIVAALNDKIEYLKARLYGHPL